MPEARYQGAPDAPLDLHEAEATVEPPIADAVTAPAVTAAVRPPLGKPASGRAARAEDAGVDRVWSIYEAALRAWGKMTVIGAPGELENAIVIGCGQLREYLQTLGPPKPADEERRVALLAVKLKATLDAYETWSATRKRP